MASPDLMALVTQAVVESGFGHLITEVVSGTARGIDKAGEQWAHLNLIPVKQFPADWDRYGRSAGHLRNKQMAKHSEALIAIHDGESPGTFGMISTAKMMGLRVHVHLAPELKA